MTDRRSDSEGPRLPAPTFDAEDLHIVVNVLRELAGTYDDADDPNAVILRAAVSLAVKRTEEMLDANGYPVGE